MILAQIREMTTTATKGADGKDEPDGPRE